MNKPLEAVIFDLDGVITDTAEYHYLAWKALADQLGIPFSRQFNEELKGISRMDSLEKILTHGGKQARFSSEEKDQLAAKKNEHYLNLINRITPADLLPGIWKFVADINAAGVKLGIASASKNAMTVLEALGIREQFDIIVDARTICHGKPDPEIFITAAKLLEAEPSACIGIEDATAGVEAIKAAGMFAIAIGPKEQFEKADLVYNDTSELSFTEVAKRYRLKE
ncbi:beta-phosphoglucomutase [Bacillus canaveralius]|uniref:Beta-phosphoglucomutase n=1 Tax=Bacillus canaveralius TaxID=1403243 RepID=A0A2N5GSU3_9BACI|nr:beta-phosphoglucomutase [Bacillus canaveralius]PLR86841.1 beta-phosphoglucomutase [Bacillus canaveralius]PLR92698.1 beta-phosphoglucomutase [Bacillus canaveralius]